MEEKRLGFSGIVFVGAATLFTAVFALAVIALIILWIAGAL